MKNLKDEIEGILDLHFTNRNHYNFSGLLEAITSLIEQEKERAVKDWMDYLFREHGEWVELDEARYRNAWEQYLAERTK